MSDVQVSDPSAEPCWFCRTERGEESPPGGWIYDDGTWRAGHVPEGWAPAGTVVLEACRHFLDLTEMNTEETATFAATTGKVVAAIKEVTEADRVYIWSTMAQFPHMHVWLLPWWEDAPKDGPEYLVAMSELNPLYASRGGEHRAPASGSLGMSVGVSG